MNAKIYNGNVQPNHKEYKIWVNDEGIIKTWNGTEWIEQSGGGESGGSGSGSGLKYLPKYYSIDWSVAEEGWKEALKGGTFPFTEIAATAKSGNFITSQDGTTPEGIEAFSFLPVGYHNGSKVNLFETLESVINFFKTDFSIHISMNGIKEISEEEFYSFDNHNVPSE